MISFFITDSGFIYNVFEKFEYLSSQFSEVCACYQYLWGIFASVNKLSLHFTTLLTLSNFEVRFCVKSPSLQEPKEEINDIGDTGDYDYGYFDDIPATDNSVTTTDAPQIDWTYATRFVINITQC